MATAGRGRKWRAALESGGAAYKRTCQWIKPDGKPQYSDDRPGIGDLRVITFR